jgi:cytochrome c-type biogenesis protein CcmE
MEQGVETQPRSGNRIKFIVGGALIVAAIVYLVISSTRANAQYFYTIDELKSRSQSIVAKMFAFQVQ